MDGLLLNNESNMFVGILVVGVVKKCVHEFLGLLKVLDQQVLLASTNVQETILGSPSTLTRVNRVQVDFSPPGVNTLRFQSLPPSQKPIERDHVFTNMKFHLQLREGQDITEIVHNGIKSLELATLNINLEDVNPIVSILIHQSLQSLPLLASFIHMIGLANEIRPEVSTGSLGLCRNIPN